MRLTHTYPLTILTLTSPTNLGEPYSIPSLADPGGGPGGPGPPRPQDLEAPVIQFGGPVYNLRAKQ